MPICMKSGWLETANMIVRAEIKFKASLLRKERRCSYYRLDYPKMDD